VGYEPDRHGDERAHAQRLVRPARVAPDDPETVRIRLRPDEQARRQREQGRRHGEALPSATGLDAQRLRHYKTERSHGRVARGDGEHDGADYGHDAADGPEQLVARDAHDACRRDSLHLAVNLREGDALIGAALTSGKCEILLAGNQGKCCRFDEEDARAIGRNSTGVRGINLEEGDFVVGMVCIDPEEQAAKPLDILVVSENGFGKRSELDEYRKTNRGGKGVKTINITEKTGKLIAIKNVTDENDLMIITKSGLTIRMAVSDIKVAGRATQGVKLINIKDGDAIAAVSVVNKTEEEQPQDQEPVEEQKEQTDNEQI
jgi:DNA gyrase/topoisomerase IV subunit A